MRANGTADRDKKSNPYSPEYIGVEKFLDIISLEPTSSVEKDRFCLSHVFTYRDFEDGVLGLAWVAEPGKSIGMPRNTLKSCWVVNLFGKTRFLIFTLKLELLVVFVKQPKHFKMVAKKL